MLRTEDRRLRTARSRARFFVYVVELVPRAGEGPSVYVGSTALEPETRWRHHLGQGAHRAGSRHVRRRGKRLRRDLMPRRSFQTRTDAQAAEQRVRTNLERRGYKVFGSCRPSRRCTL